MALEIPRRKFIVGLASLVAAPAIVKASSLMPVRAPRFDLPENDLTPRLPAVGDYVIQGNVEWMATDPRLVMWTGSEWVEMAILDGYSLSRA